MTAKIKFAFLAPDGFQDQLRKELDGVLSCHGRLILTDRPPKQPPLWVQNSWHNPVLIPIQSISDAAKKLKALQRNWSLYSFQLHRRAQLIQEQLPHISFKPLSFPSALPPSPLGSWTLLDRDTLLAASDCSSVFSNGEVHFLEDKKNPPNRAYLKLWEALTLVQEYPCAGQYCIDVGSSPGGWTWVLAKLGAEVLSIDRSPLDDRVSKMQGVHFQKRDAFSLKPEEMLKSVEGKVWEWTIPSAELHEAASKYVVSGTTRTSDGVRIRVVADDSPADSEPSFGRKKVRKGEKFKSADDKSEAAPPEPSRSEPSAEAVQPDSAEYDVEKQSFGRAKKKRTRR